MEDLISRPENYLIPKLMNERVNTLHREDKLQIEEKDGKENERNWWGNNNNILSNGGGVQ